MPLITEEVPYMYDTDANWSWKSVTGGKGQLYVQGTYGLIKPLAGGRYNLGTYSGSLGRAYNDFPWDASVNVSFRPVFNSNER